MNRCESGLKWDTLLKDCIKNEDETQQPTTVSVLEVSTISPVQIWTVGVSVGVCIVLISFVLALLLCFVIYRKHSNRKGNPLHLNGAPYSRTVSLQNQDSSALGPHTNGTTHEASVCHPDWGRGLCIARAEHAIPLPATELGDSALVTTKTVQPVVHAYDVL